MNTEIEVLNAAADDWESLDQILLSIRFEFASDVQNPAAPNDSYWRDRNSGTTIGEIANTIRHLIQSGELIARREDGTNVVSLSGDDVLVCWFHASESGKQKLLSYTPPSTSATS